MIINSVTSPRSSPCATFGDTHCTIRIVMRLENSAPAVWPYTALRTFQGAFLETRFDCKTQPLFQRMSFDLPSDLKPLAGFLLLTAASMGRLRLRNQRPLHQESLRCWRWWYHGCLNGVYLCRRWLALWNTFEHDLRLALASVWSRSFELCFSNRLFHISSDPSEIVCVFIKPHWY